jgi:biofilm PGA synthesis N-glycosyltransferase PgaC
MDSLLIHRKIFFNPKYGILGIMTYPFCFCFEWLAPWLEILGFLYFIFLSFLDEVNWVLFFMLLAFVYLSSLFISFVSIFYDEITYNKYKNKQDLMNMYLTALLEPIIYHPISIIWALKGNLAYLRRDKKWGQMERSGFKTN